MGKNLLKEVMVKLWLLDSPPSKLASPTLKPCCHSQKNPLDAPHAAGHEALDWTTERKFLKRVAGSPGEPVRVLKTT